MADAPRLYMFEGGSLKVKLHSLKMGQGFGEDVVIPVPWYVLTHPGGNVLIDGGNPLGVAVAPERYFGDDRESGSWPIMRAEDAVVPQLHRVGIDPASIRWIVQSHLHLDHVGALASIGAFPSAQVLVSRQEYAYALDPDWFVARHYVQSEFNRPGVNWVFLEDHEDGYDVFGDGVLRCWHSPGHSVGHLSFTVRLPESGAFLLAVDAAYTRDHWDERVLPSLTTSATEIVRSVRRLHRLADREHGVVIPGHDPDVWASLRLAPDYYA